MHTLTHMGTHTHAHIQEHKVNPVLVNRNDWYHWNAYVSKGQYQYMSDLMQLNRCHPHTTIALDVYNPSPLLPKLGNWAQWLVHHPDQDYTCNWCYRESKLVFELVTTTQALINHPHTICCHVVNTRK